MDSFARIVIGYHGCDPAFADALIAGRTLIRDWKPSRNTYDWLGEGVYFWEYGRYRASDWGRGGVVGAYIQLGTCLDLTDTAYMEPLREHYEALVETYQTKGLTLPTNRGKKRRIRELDCLVINEFVASIETNGVRFQTVRGPFLEGDPVFPGSGILRESHIQIAVRDNSCILGVFRPNLA
jgi:hypothetical protein